jgi:hypothetical protein
MGTTNETVTQAAAIRPCLSAGAIAAGCRVRDGVHAFGVCAQAHRQGRVEVQGWRYEERT